GAEPEPTAQSLTALPDISLTNSGSRSTWRIWHPLARGAAIVKWTVIGAAAGFGLGFLGHEQIRRRALCGNEDLAGSLERRAGRQCLRRGHRFDAREAGMCASGRGPATA